MKFHQTTITTTFGVESVIDFPYNGRKSQIVGCTKTRIYGIIDARHSSPHDFVDVTSKVLD